MELSEILAQEDFRKVVAMLTENEPTNEIETLIDQYNGQHEILNRPDKIIKGESTKLARLIYPLQKKIVETTVAFTIGKGIKLTQPESENSSLVEGLDIIKEQWKTMKLDNHTKNLLRRLCIETRVAELFYSLLREGDDKPKIRVQLLCKEEGDDIFPFWDEYKDLTAFTRKYIKKINGKDCDAVDIWTEAVEIHAERVGGKWIRTEKPNPYGKIPVIYYEQPEPEWKDVQSVIDRIEMLISKNADANDYFSNPTVKLKGKLITMPKKDEVAKLLQFEKEVVDGKEQYGDAEYLTWDRTPESVKSEYEILKDIAHTQTYTPDLSFNNVKGLGSAVSGVVFEFMFMDPMLKSTTKREMLTEGLARRINLLKEMLKTTDAEVGQIAKTNSMFDDLEVFFEFEDIMPKNIGELLDNIGKAIEGKSSMSRKRAVELNPLVTDPVEELKQIEKEDEEAMAALLPEGESFNPGSDAASPTKVIPMAKQK